MKTLNKSGILTFLMLLIGFTAFAQESQPKVKSKKKVVIITKTTDADGNVTTEKIIKEGNDANVFILENEEINLDELKELDVEVNAEDIKKAIRIKIAEGAGDEAKVFEWDGEGEIPEGLEALLKEKDIQIELDGDHNIFHLNGNAVDATPNKACLGVRIGQKITVENINGEETEVVEGMSEIGVKILGVIADSGAEEAGLLEEDVITSINGNQVETLDDVLSVLAPFDPGTTVSIVYKRDGATLMTNAIMKTCGNTAIFEEIVEEVEVNEVVSGTKSKTVTIRKNKNDLNEIVEVEEIDGAVSSFPMTEQTLDIETLDIFPNPSGGKFTVEFKAPAKATTVKVFDLNGKEVYGESLNSFDGIYKKELDLSTVAKGTLLLSIQQGDKVFSEPIILQ